MSSILMSSECQPARNLSLVSVTISPSCSHSTSPSKSLNHPWRRNHGLLWHSFGAFQIEENRKFNSASSCRPCASGWALSRRSRFSEESGGSRRGASRWRMVVNDNDGLYGGLQNRRQFVGMISTWIVLLGFVNTGSVFDVPAAASEEQSPSSTAASTKPGLIDKLLERSKANKAKNDQQRLDDYYKRNYKDYFDFIKGSIINKDKDKVTEAEQGILKWLEKNQ